LLVILEGPDASGKTTLANALVEEFNAEVRKCGPPETDRPFYEYQARLHACAGARVVYDRFFHGESVYGPIFRERGLTPTEQFYLELEATLLNGIVVWCGAPREVILDRIRSRHDQSYFDKQLLTRYDEVTAAYGRVQHACRMRQLHYDSSSETPENVIEVLRPNVQDETILPKHRYAIGNCREPNAALVGDRFSRFQTMPVGGAHEWRMEPYCHYRPFIKTPASEYLWRAILDVPEIKAYTLYVTNSVKDQLTPAHGRSVLERELNGMDRVIALGKHASKRLEEVDVEHQTLHHPQFWKRFHYRERARYSALLKEAIFA